MQSKQIRNTLELIIRIAVLCDSLTWSVFQYVKNRKDASWSLFYTIYMSHDVWMGVFELAVEQETSSIQIVELRVRVELVGTVQK